MAVWTDLLAHDLATLLRCPRCGGQTLTGGETSLDCPACGAAYPLDRDRQIASLLGAVADTAIKEDIRKWWGDLYEQIYGPTDHTLTADSLDSLLADTEDMFRRRELLPVVEMPLDQLKGKTVLEIGPGGGGHSALFASKGASVVACDITPQRAISTALKLSLIRGGEGRAYQGDAETLPFRDASFDVVYSNGVLHHSENTDRTIAEVFRVLKPGGRAVLMLYSRHSAIYWLNIVPRALFGGEMFGRPEAEWAGRVTEGKPKFGETKNPITRIYSARELHRLLAAFRVVSLRKSSFQFDNFAVPRLTQLRDKVLAWMGRKPHPGGILVYGRPFFVETELELALGRHAGFAWNIVAEKPV